MTALSRALRCAGMATFVASSLLAASPAANTVTIGSETKKTTGVVKNLEAGDVACYITLADDRGVEFTELADFELCEQTSLRGKRVRLTYAIGNVMAAECQGDPECTKTERVPLVTAARVESKPSTKTSPPKTTAPKQSSFCTPMETVVFACSTGKKLVSVCASKNASERQGYLQYRFGTPDSRDPIELMLPSGEPLPSDSASGENVPFAGGGGSWLRFRNGDYGYVVYTGIGRWGPKGEPQEKQGVVVERRGKAIATLPCVGKLTSELGPEWFEKTGVSHNDEEFLFPE